MRILMINKFLHPNGGSETYIFKLAQQFEKLGHEVQFFGMDHINRCVGNRLNVYTSTMDFHHSSAVEKVKNSLKTIYSMEARKKIRQVLEDFNPDICHLNNFNYQLTPSILLEIDSWRKQTNKICRIVYTAHDYQLVCPNHMMIQPVTKSTCELCVGGNFMQCTKHRCIHNSLAKSLIGTLEASLWNHVHVYRLIDDVVCCSAFIESKLKNNQDLSDKTVVMHNFIEGKIQGQEPLDYVLYFGRYSKEKGVGTLIEACRRLPEISFVFAGKGEYEDEIKEMSNIENKGFLSSDELNELIQKAKFTLCPSEWYENCPFSVLESLERGVPVLGSDMGGIPELIQDGKNGMIFESGNLEDLTMKLKELWENENLVRALRQACREGEYETVETYCLKLLDIYQGKRISK